MSHKLFFDTLTKTPDDNAFEVVEIKGVGHPDTLADALAARISIDYTKWWMDELGLSVKEVPHHNFDKVLLSGGEVNICWGGGEILKPFNAIIAGNATVERGSCKFPLNTVAYQSTRDVLKKNVGESCKWNLDVSQVSTSSETLSNTYSHGLFANDTSFGTGHYPLTKLETNVKKVNEVLEKVMKEKRFLGTDVKIMGRRLKKEFVITLAAGIKDKSVSDAYEYYEKLSYLKDRVCRQLPRESVVNINQNDTPNKGGAEKNYYLLVSGSSVESADPGQVGRGNRITGMITPFRPQTLEAVAGKNLTRHVGGFYNIWAQEIARKIWKENGIPAQVVIVSEIGKPVEECCISVSTKGRANENAINDICEEVIHNYHTYLNELLFKGGEHYPFNYIR